MIASELAMFVLFWLATARLQSRGMRSGTLALCGFNLAMALGLLLLAMRPQWPGFLTDVGCNVVLLLAFALLWHGGAMHLRGTPRREPFVVWVLGSLAMTILYLGWPDSNARVAVFYSLDAWVIARAGLLAYAPLMQRGEHGQRAARAFRLMAIVAATALILRVLSGLWSHSPIDVGGETPRSYVMMFGVLWGLTLTNGFLAYAVVRALIRELERLATIDPLTGLLNRRAFLDCCQKHWALWKRQSKPFALATVDVDHFKSVNDTYGHETGDQALKLIATALQVNARPTDEVARIGGEEMVVIFGNAASEEQIFLATERLRKAIATMAPPPAMGERRLTVSIGVAMVQPEDTASNQVLLRSDEALYRAKGAGRNRVCMDGVPETTGIHPQFA